MLNSVSIQRHKPLGKLLSHLVFWMLMFSIARIIFLCYQAGDFSENSWSEILSSFLYGWRMDLSMSAYLLIFPFLSLSIQQFVNLPWLTIVVKGYTYVLVTLMAIVVASELELFVEWGVKLNSKALKYLENPSEVWGIASNRVVFMNALVITSLLFFSIFLQRRLKLNADHITSTSLLSRILFILFVPGFLLLMIRGGLQQIPMNQSVAYYSQNNTLNNAAVNSLWNVMFSVLKSKDYLEENPYQYGAKEEAEQIVNKLYTYPKDSTAQLLTTTTPNVVYLILEGWSADVVESMGGYQGITPNFDRLTENGYLFTSIYSAGMRSHEGMAAIFSGFPALPQSAITSDPSKYPSLPVMNRQLREKKYTSFFGFGGELNYGNIKSYLVYAGFDKLVEDSDFPYGTPRAKLGVHDEYALPRFADELNQLQSPFFASWFTLSSHAPYDIPVAYHLDINGTEVGYINSVHYTDSCLGAFFDNIRKAPWYNNTLFVVMSDHGHSSPKKTPYYHPDYRKIPLLLYGNVLKEEYRGVENHKIGSQCDLVATLLAQLQLDYGAYRWSKDLLNPLAPEFAYFVFDDGLGYIDRENYFSFHHELNMYMDQSYTDSTAMEATRKKGKSHLQVVFEEFLNL